MAGSPIQESDWGYFCSKADADKMQSTVKALAGNGDATLSHDTWEARAYTADGPNPDNVQVWLLDGFIDNGMGGQFNRDGTPKYTFSEYAGGLLDRETNPKDGVDAYPLPAKVRLVYSTSEQGLVWKAAD